MKIIFLGTPEFAVASLDILVQHNYDVVGVITAPDKPSGRGQKLSMSAVKTYAMSKGLRVLQPVNMKSPAFLEEVRALKADLQIVVAFRMMPEVLWSMPPLGTFNLHGSLLPQYRGAAPINWAVMNGEVITGVTTFFLAHEIDTGKIAFREEMAIGEDETAGELHDRMMLKGAELVLKTVKALEEGNLDLHPQEDFLLPGTQVHPAPKLNKEVCHINPNRSASQLHNQVRGLSPHPGAFFEYLNGKQELVQVKVYRTCIAQGTSAEPPGTIVSDRKNYIKICTSEGYLELLELQLPGRKRMSAVELLRGFHFEENAIALSTGNG
jgi:methionyl-tRNA formyltransferase